jgi:hypothetical protein
VPLDIIAFLVSPSPASALPVLPLTLPRAANLFAILTGIRSDASPMVPERGRLPSAPQEVSLAFDEAMVFGESYIDRGELSLALARWEESDGALRAPYEHVYLRMGPDDFLVFGFSG